MRCNEGALTARLTVNSDDGQVKSCTAPISVAAVAAPDFSSQPSDVNAAADDVPSLTLIDCDQIPAADTVSHSQTLTIVDDVAPVITGSDLEDHAATCQSPPTPCEAVAVDNSDDSVMIITGTSTVAGSCPSDFLRIFTFTATDSAGNEAVVLQTITVTDTEKPQLLNLPPPPSP